jgi:Tol biopolymer transport system component
MFVSLQEIVETARPALPLDEYRNGDFYAFHVKWNPQGDRLMLVLRWVPHSQQERTRSQLLTMNADGSDIRVALPASAWDRGGHHPNWCPDGTSILMNLRIHGPAPSGRYARRLARLYRRARRSLQIRDDGMRFVRFRYDGTGRQPMDDRIMGSGHPTLHPDGRHVVTDAYPDEPVAFGDGTTPIRLIDLESSRATALVRIKTRPSYRGPSNQMRVDPHPAWDHQFRRIAFNACPDGTRRVYVADLSGVVG